MAKTARRPKVANHPEVAALGKVLKAVSTLPDTLSKSRVLSHAAEIFETQSASEVTEIPAGVIQSATRS